MTRPHSCGVTHPICKPANQQAFAQPTGIAAAASPLRSPEAMKQLTVAAYSKKPSIVDYHCSRCVVSITLNLAITASFQPRMPILH